jgi:small-conductance mechanosensitive channel
LRNEFHLSDADMARVRQLHEGYKPKCAEMCTRIAAKKAEIRAVLTSETGVTAEAQKKLTELGELRAQCQAQMLQHFIAVSQAMPPEQGRRYLAEMKRLTLSFHEEIEQSMSEPAGHEHHHQ